MQFASTLSYIETLQPQMVEWTKAWASINSGSFHAQGLERMLSALKKDFSVLEGMAEEIAIDPLLRFNREGDRELVPLGKALRIRKRPEAPVQVLFAGHMDTVFGKEHPFQAVRSIDENTLGGPGVADLKGGLAVMLTTLMAFEKSSVKEAIGWEVLINPDEEIGSPGSDILLKEAASKNDFGLAYEPALPDGTLAGARKGSGNFTVIARGRAAHAGRAFHEGRSAIAGLAEFIRYLHQLNGKQVGVTVNIGMVEGGRALNIVPDRAIARFNVRVANLQEQTWVEAQLASIHQSLEENLDGVSFELHGGFGRPPKTLSAGNIALFELIKECGKDLDMSVQWQETGGVCDGNNLAAYGLPNIDTMGVRGGELHSDREFMLIDSLAERAKLGTLLLLKIASGDAHFLSKERVN